MSAARIAVKAGQCYRAKASRGYRTIRVGSVRRSADVPYVVAVELGRDGRPARGRDRLGMPRGRKFHTFLTWDAARRLWVMPTHYAEVA